MRLDVDDARSRLAAARVARLATVDARGRPHLVPITFAVAGDVIVTAVDHKPKRSSDLARLRNIHVNPRVSVLADHYEERWENLWWARADGVARILDAGDDATGHAAAVALLVERYAQYRGRRPAGPVISIRVEAWTGWAWRDDREVFKEG